MWKIFGFGIIHKSPTVEKLPVHLPGQKFRVIGKVGEPANNTEKNSMLEAFFLLNAQRRAARDYYPLLYSNVTRYYTFDQRKGMFKPRERLGQSPSGVVLNRIDTVSVMEGERYFLRLLLLKAKSPCSYTDLLTVNGKIEASFQDACQEKSLSVLPLWRDWCLLSCCNIVTWQIR